MTLVSMYVLNKAVSGAIVGVNAILEPFDLAPPHNQTLTDTHTAMYTHAVAEQVANLRRYYVPRIQLQIK